MKRTIFWTLWLLMPIALLAWHFGPGQAFFERDLAAEQLDLGQRAEAGNDYQMASARYAKAREELPAGSVAEQRRIALEEANAQIRAGNLIAGQEQMEKLITDMEADDQPDSELLASVRHDLATSSYYAAWIMRLEGAETEEWLQEAEQARQQFRLLAEENEGLSEEGQVAAVENLEATIRLEQMDLRTLMAKPLPKNCCSNCNGLCQKKRKQAASRCKQGKKEGEGKKRQDARKAIKKQTGAGLNSGNGTGS